MLVPQLRQILGRHEKATKTHTLVPVNHISDSSVLVDLRVLLHYLGAVQVRTLDHIYSYQSCFAVHHRLLFTQTQGMR